MEIQEYGKMRFLGLVLIVFALITGCARSTLSPTPTSSRPWTEEEVTFNFGSTKLFGIVTLPASKGPHPAIIIISGSVDPMTGVRGGVGSQYHIDHARSMVLQGFAVLRYDPPGVGKSGGQPGIESLDTRTEEAVAALNYFKSRPDISPGRVGMFSDSQGVWVIAMAAAAHPQDVAFIISVSGSGVPLAEQQIYSIEAQSKAYGMPEVEITKAILFGRLLVDWQLTHPIYREVNQAAALALGDGPWNSFLKLVYEPGEITPAEGLLKGIEILKSIQDEPWAKFLYLKEVYIPQLEAIPPEQIPGLKAIVEPNMLNDPRQYLTQVRCPVLAFFGADDVLQPTQKSAALYEEYLTAAGNKNFKIVVIPGVGHEITLGLSAYREELSSWLKQLYQ